MIWSLCVIALLASAMLSSCKDQEQATIAVASITLNKQAISLVVGSSETLSDTVAPSNATNKNVTWNSNKTDVASVDGNGKVTALKAGTATITVTTVDGNKTATCAVTVNASQPATKHFVVAYSHAQASGEYRLDPSIRWNAITHLNLAFIFANTDGTLRTSGIYNPKQIVEEAHKHGVKVLVSLGGQFYQPVKNHRSKLVDEILKYVRDNNLDGFDIDFEDYNPNDAELPGNLLAFAQELNRKKDTNMIQSLAGRCWNSGYAKGLHESFDIINLMAYGVADSSPGPIAPMDYCVRCVNFWKIDMETPASKLALGVPFWGDSWSGNTIVGEYWYQEILDMHPTRDVHSNDQIDNIYYNGKKTITMKAEWAKENIGGIMIWNISHGHDTREDDDSLLEAIGKVMRP